MYTWLEAAVVCEELYRGRNRYGRGLREQVQQEIKQVTGV